MADQPTKMQRGQARFDHIAARGHAAFKVPVRQRTAEHKQDIARFRATFGDEEANSAERGAAKRKRNPFRAAMR